MSSDEIVSWSIVALFGIVMILFVIFPERTKSMMGSFFLFLVSLFFPVIMYDIGIFWFIFVGIPVSVISLCWTFSMLFPNTVGTKLKRFISNNFKRTFGEERAANIIIIAKKFPEYAIAGLYKLMLVAVGLVVARYTIFTPFEQGYYWLKYGEVPERDLYWLTSPSECKGLSNFPLQDYVNAKDFCREEMAFQTGWVGLQQVINYTFDMHILIIAVALLFVYSIAEKY